MKRVIVTGGSRGIGAEIVRGFGANGDRVAFIWLSSEESARKLSEETGALPVRADVSSSDGVARAMDEATAYLGGVDVLVNCAGIAQIKLFTDLTDGDWDRMVSTDLSGCFYTCRYAAREMVRSHGGRIINIGSVWGRVGASCEVHYSAVKAGVRGMTLALAKELGPSGITVNCVEPGVIATDMNAALDSSALDGLKEATPLCRIGNASDVAELVLFLASDRASFITGQCIGVDGGFGL